MSNKYYTPEDTAYYVKPSRLNRQRKRKWRQDLEVERAIAEWKAEAEQGDRANG